MLLSGRGSNLQALIAARDRGELAIDLVLAGGDRPAAAGFEHARATGIPVYASDARNFVDRAAFESDLFAQIEESAADLLVLAGYMRILTAATVESWRGRLINIHPSLLPKYPGLHTHARALAAGDVEHGASVHYVTPVLDGGPVLMQTRIPVLAGDSPEALAARLLPQEHRLLVASVALIAAGRAQLQGDTILVDGSAIASPLSLPLPTG